MVESQLSGVARNNILYLKIIYLKCLWEGFKTPHFGHKMKESGLAGVERKNVFYLKCILKASKHRVLQIKW